MMGDLKKKKKKKVISDWSQKLMVKWHFENSDWLEKNQSDDSRMDFHSGSYSSTMSRSNVHGHGIAFGQSKEFG